MNQTILDAGMLAGLVPVDHAHLGWLVFGTFLLFTGLTTAFKATTCLRAFSHGEAWLDRLLRRGSAFVLFLAGLGLASGGVWFQVRAVFVS